MEFLLKIYRFFLSVTSIVRINLFIFLKKKIQQKKIIFFYFPVKSYQENILELVDELKKNNQFTILLGYNASTFQEINKYNNSFFLNLGYLKYIYNIDIFLSSYVVYNLPNASNKVYINHDIYDTPMVNENNEKNLIYALNKCNYIFLSSEIAIIALEKKINSYLEDNNKKNLKLINTGYLKLDHVHKKVYKSSISEDAILLAPTLSSMFLEYNLSPFLDEIIHEILNDKKFKLIYRPHPGDAKNNHIKKIREKYTSNKNFFLDLDTSYLDSYAKSKILITDFSGTAYTYAFSKLRPVIFISRNEKVLKQSNLNDLYFFKDRHDVGEIIENIYDINNEIYSIYDKINTYSEIIKKLREKRIKYFNDSIEQNLMNIKNILEN